MGTHDWLGSQSCVPTPGTTVAKSVQCWIYLLLAHSAMNRLPLDASAVPGWEWCAMATFRQGARRRSTVQISSDAYCAINALQSVVWITSITQWNVSLRVQAPCAPMVHEHKQWCRYLCEPPCR